MAIFLDILKGMIMGIANIIPGVSGGTLALSMGIYDKLIGAISNLLHDWKKSVMTLLPIFLGCGLGIIGFTYLIQYLLDQHTFVTCMGFIGLILGGVPVLVQQLKEKMAETHSRISISSILTFLLLFATAIMLPLLGSDQETLTVLVATPQMMLSLFFVGVIASATMVVPGVSGSLVLMILGYYYGILDGITRFLEALKIFDVPSLWNGVLILAPFGIGILLGIFLIAKLISYLFTRFGVQTYCGILGLILSSPFAIFYNTGVLETLNQLNILIIGAGILFALVGGVVTYFLGEK